MTHSEGALVIKSKLLIFTAFLTLVAFSVACEDSSQAYSIKTEEERRLYNWANDWAIEAGYSPEYAHAYGLAIVFYADRNALHVFGRKADRNKHAHAYARAIEAGHSPKYASEFARQVQNGKTERYAQAFAQATIVERQTSQRAREKAEKGR